MAQQLATKELILWIIFIISTFVLFAVVYIAITNYLK